VPIALACQVTFFHFFRFNIELSWPENEALGLVKAKNVHQTNRDNRKTTAISGTMHLP
jgi:hypothetical protein